MTGINLVLVLCLATGWAVMVWLRVLRLQRAERRYRRLQALLASYNLYAYLLDEDPRQKRPPPRAA